MEQKETRLGQNKGNVTNIIRNVAHRKYIKNRLIIFFKCLHFLKLDRDIYIIKRED